MSDPSIIYTIKELKEIDKIASFYNNYKSIPLKDIKEIEMLGSLPNNYTTVGLDGKFPYPKKVKKIIDDIFIIVLPSFLIILENYNIKTSIGVSLSNSETSNNSMIVEFAVIVYE